MVDALLPSTRINLERATVLVLDDNGEVRRAGYYSVTVTPSVSIW